MRTTHLTIALISIISFLSVGLNAQMADVKLLGLEDAKRVANAAHERAQRDNWNVAISVVDAGGHLIYFKKMDGTQLASIEVSIEKATTALFYKRPTKVFQDGLAGGNTALLSLPDFQAFEGGLPIEHNGHIIGAIGVSGVTPQQDGIIAQAGLDAL